MASLQQQNFLFFRRYFNLDSVSTTQYVELFATVKRTISAVFDFFIILRLKLRDKSSDILRNDIYIYYIFIEVGYKNYYIFSEILRLCILKLLKISKIYFYY